MRSGVVLVLKGVLFVVMAVLFQHCGEDEKEQIDLSKDQEYMPLVVGFYQLYDVTETVYVNGPVGEVSHYEMKTEIVDSIPELNGVYTYVIHRQVRADASQAWENKDTWSAVFSETEAIVKQGNTSFLKLVSPLSQDLFWDGNLYNSLGTEEYRVSSVGQPLVVNEVEFADVVEVTHSNEVDGIVGNDVRKEIYARGVGLVKRTEEVVVYCSQPTCIGEKIIESGRVSEQVLLEYGKN
jgi:hypothetical protein